MQMSEKSIEQLAPDPASLKAGQGLALLSKWQSTGLTELGLWGEARGSGSKPYQVHINFADMGNKCSCPSRKFPCKHVLGLMLLHARGHIATASPPEWFTTWQQKRQERSETKQEAVQQTSPDSKTQTKRLKARDEKVSAGVAELSLWLQDLLRQGLASWDAHTENSFEHMAKRLIDAQASGLATRVRNIHVLDRSVGWQGKILQALGQLYLLAEAYPKLDTLPEAVQADIKTAIGFTADQKALQEQQGISDLWTVLAQITEEEKGLFQRRTWLYGQGSQQYGLILEFSHGRPQFDVLLCAGFSMNAELVFFPSSTPFRAIIKNHSPAYEPAQVSAHSSFASFLNYYAQVLGQNPFVERVPVCFADTRFSEGQFVDGSGYLIPSTLLPEQHMHLLALTGGQPCMVMGEWYNDFFHPLSVQNSTWEAV